MGGFLCLSTREEDTTSKREERRRRSSRAAWAIGPWRKMGTDVTELKQSWGKAYFAPIYEFGSKEIVTWSTSMSPDMAQQMALLDRFLAKMPEGETPYPAQRHGLAVPARGADGSPEGGEDNAEHVQEGQLRRQRRHGAGLRPRQGRVLPGKVVGRLRVLQIRPRFLCGPLEHDEAPG